MLKAAIYPPTTTGRLNNGIRLNPESCMKINEKFEYYLKTKGYFDLGNIEKYSTGKNDDGGFYPVNYHPSGEPEAFICCVAKDSK
jgi:hypothetical protein